MFFTFSKKGKMKKIITIMILGTILLVSCAKENDIKSAPSIDWSTENIDKYLGTDIYCTIEKQVDNADAYISISEAIEKMDKVYVDTTFHVTGNIKTVYTKRLCKLNDSGEYDGNDYLLGNSESDLEEMNGEQGVLVGTFFVDENGDWGLDHVHIEK